MKKRALPWVLLATAAISLTVVVKTGYDYRSNARSNQALAQAAESTAAPQASQKPSELPLELDWEVLRSVNDEVAGWLLCPDTVISYPVVQCFDNKTYVSTDFYGKKNDAGALFFDSRNDVSRPDKNLVIYGHQMYDDSMLGLLPKWVEEVYYQRHPVMYLLTEKQSYRVELFSCRLVEGKDSYFETRFDSDADYQLYLDRAVAQSYWQSATVPSAEYSTLTLVTCSYYPYVTEPRLLLHGQLIPIE